MQDHSDATNHHQGKANVAKFIAPKIGKQSQEKYMVSTILEEMFQFFSGGVRHLEYRVINKSLRLRLALAVFVDFGFARLDTMMKQGPMFVPTSGFLKQLALNSLTTGVEPMLVPHTVRCVSQGEARLHRQYAVAFESAIRRRLPKFLEEPKAILNMWEMGLMHHSRAPTGHSLAPTGDLVWSLTSTGVLTFSEQAGSSEDAIEAHMTKHSVTGMASTSPSAELEFEIDSENILLLREDELPLSREVLQILEISHTELQHLFKSAAMLLAESNSVDRMRCYVARDSCGEWQVELLSP